MGLKYREDKHLEFLSTLSNEELDVLVEILTSTFTNDLDMEERYKKYYPDHKKYWDLIAADYQHFGGNSFINIFRGGVLYEEILKDVCDKMKVNYPKKASVEEIEKNLIQKVIGETIEQMTLEEKKQFLKEMDLKTTNFTQEAVMGAVQVAIKNSGFFAYKMSVIVANSIAKNMIGRGLSFAANKTLTKSISIFAGPIGWIISSGWFLIDIAGPAYRITIPATVYIASLRQSKLKKALFEKKLCPNCQKSIPTDANFCLYCGEKL